MLKSLVFVGLKLVGVAAFCGEVQFGIDGEREPVTYVEVAPRINGKFGLFVHTVADRFEVVARENYKTVEYGISDALKLRELILRRPSRLQLNGRPQNARLNCSKVPNRCILTSLGF